MALKDRIKEARTNNALTQEQLAKKLGIAKSTLAGYETGNREPSIEMVAKILQTLDIDANYLWQDETDFPMQVSYDEMEHIKKYRTLDQHGKEMVDVVLQKEYDRMNESALFVRDNVLEYASAEPAAAHERTDVEVTDSMRKHDDDIMDSEDF